MNLGSIVSVAALMLVVSPAAGAAESEPKVDAVDWFRFLGPTLDGKSPEQGIRVDWEEEGLPLVWTREVGEGYSAPTVARGLVFQFDRHEDSARLVALDRVTGRQIWVSEYPTQYRDMYGYSGGPRASPVVDEDRVFAFGVEGLLRAHNIETGEVIWEVDTTRRFGVVQNFFGVGSTPVVDGDLLITRGGGSPPGSPPIHSGEVVGNGSGIVAFDKATGEVRYSISDELASYSSPVVHEIGDRRWGLAFMRGGLLGFDPQAGRVEFEFSWRARKLESVNAATPIVIGDAVFITESYGPGAALVRPEPGTAHVVRVDDPTSRTKSMASHWSTPIYHAGFVYGSSGESSGNSDLRCIDPRTGEIEWAEKLPRSTLLYVDQHLVVLTERGSLMLLPATPKGFERITAIELGDKLGYPSWNAPVLSHGILYLRGSKSLLALELIETPARGRVEG
ncbi:MAG: PQQ-binding-like beta-propeller repeat protein [Acidobacteriota bacterium]